MNVTGKGSWFGGPADATDSGHTANGETTKTPGIAVYNHGTLNGYWRVKAPNGKTVVVKQTDIGPAPWTGRKIDVTYSALGKFGYGEHNFPTDSEFKAEYLGKNAKLANAQPIPQAPKVGQAKLPGTPKPESTGTPTLDTTAFRKAGTDAAIGKLIASTEGTKNNPLFSTGILSTKEPSPSEFMKTQPGQQEHAANPVGPSSIPKTPAQDEGKVAQIVSEANHIASAKVPYLWGGGHGARVLPNTKVTPLDCSGAVSAALGINPKVSGEFERWGAPGKGGLITIYANDHHVIMEVNGKFWGTSASNPGGGAGWIKPGVVTPEYLKQFTARHPAEEQVVAMHKSGPVVKTPHGTVFIPHQ